MNDTDAIRKIQVEQEIETKLDCAKIHLELARRQITSQQYFDEYAECLHAVYIGWLSKSGWKNC